VVASILAGNTAGQLWEIPGEGQRSVLLLWDKGNDVFYLTGEGHETLARNRLADLISHQALPQAKAEGVRRFKVRALSESLEPILPQIFAGVDLHASPSLFCVHDPASNTEIVPAPSMSGVYLERITGATFAEGAYAGSEQVRDEIRGMWPSEERFHECGFGMLAIRDGGGADPEIVCWCTAEYVGPTHCGVGIATNPAFERRGIATATALSFVGEARARGLTPCWECGVLNLASRRVAQKAGFVRVEEPRYWVGSLAPG